MRVRSDGKIELSKDGEWGRFTSEFSSEFLKEEHYLQYMKDASAIEPQAKVFQTLVKYWTRMRRNNKKKEPPEQTTP